MNQSINPKLHFYYGDEQIFFERKARPDNQNRVQIKVHPDCRVVVSAPPQTSDTDVLLAVKKRSRWIYTQLREFRAQTEFVTPRRYVSGESHYYLGKQYQLKVVEIPDQVQGVKLFRGRLEVSVRQKSDDLHLHKERIKRLLINWYKTRAKAIFENRLDAMLDQAIWVDAKPSLHILTMRTQWGSCSPQGKLTLNPYLVKAPRECIDYVILHELCHIAEHSHNERFYRLLTQVMPDWEKTKERLDGMASTLIS